MVILISWSQTLYKADRVISLQKATKSLGKINNWQGFIYYIDIVIKQ